jgi:hypothetical protein
MAGTSCLPARTSAALDHDYLINTVTSRRPPWALPVERPPFWTEPDASRTSQIFHYFVSRRRSVDCHPRKGGQIFFVRQELNRDDF